MSDKFNKEAITRIDKERLDEEWVTHSDRFLEYSIMLADARDSHLEREAALEVAEAVAELDIRERPKKYGMKLPIREGAIKTQIVLHPKVIKAKRLLNKAKHRVNLLDGVVKALDHRKRALEKLVDLHGQGYFSAPRMPKDEFGKGGKTSKKKMRRNNDDD